MNLYPMADMQRFPRMTTEELRSAFLLEELFKQGEIVATYIDLDRTVVGSAVPLGEALKLESYPELRSSYFLERRELGVLNLGSTGKLLVDGVHFALGKLDCAYIGRGSEEVLFMSDDASCPAQFYLLSYPAHAVYPTGLKRFSELEALELGAAETCNRRTVYKAIYDKGLQSCQLVMGFTLLKEGSIWNTIPPHTHMRRSEVYLYFDVPPAERIVHLLGPPQETRHLLVANQQAVVSPAWSIHSGAGTTSYGFCWGMGGENQAYDDMDAVSIASLR
jgi:4-deoxy-L-threo-5-hexosulose-uronate ketol-isomerase